MKVGTILPSKNTYCVTLDEYLDKCLIREAKKKKLESISVSKHHQISLFWTGVILIQINT